MDVRIKMGSTMMVVGPSNSGKTVFIVKLINHSQELFDITPKTVYWCYGHRTNMHDYLTQQGFTMIDGIPENFTFIKPYSVIVLDDLMLESANSKPVTDLFIRGAHHVPCFVIFTLHNLFHKSEEARNRQLNSQYLVMFKNPRDPSQIDFLSRQMFPNSKGYLVSIFENATLNAHSYLLIDLHQKTPALLKVRARILPSEKPMVAYVNKRLYSEIVLNKRRWNA